MADCRRLTCGRFICTKRTPTNPSRTNGSCSPQCRCTLSTTPLSAPLTSPAGHRLPESNTRRSVVTPAKAGVQRDHYRSRCLRAVAAEDFVHPRQLPRGEHGAWGGAPGWDTARTPSQNITVREHQNIKSGDHTQISWPRRRSDQMSAARRSVRRRGRGPIRAVAHAASAA